MRMKLSIILAVIFLLSVIGFTEILYESNLEVVGTPSITNVGDNFYLSWLDGEDVLHLARVKFRVSGEQIPILLEKDISVKGVYSPDIASYEGDVLMGWVDDDSDVYIQLYEQDSLDVYMTRKYAPYADGAVNVSPYGDYVLNTWVSSEKPGLTIVITNPDNKSNICDERVNYYKPEDNTASVAQYNDYIYCAWNDDGEVHVTIFQLNSVHDDIINDWDNEIDAKTDLPPAICATDGGIIFVAWADDVEENIYIQAYDVTENVLDPLKRFDFPIEGCQGLDITVMGRKVYVSYGDEEGEINVVELKN